MTTHIQVPNKVCVPKSYVDHDRVYIDEVVRRLCIDKDAALNSRLIRENFVPKENIDDIHADFRLPSPKILRQNSILLISPSSESPSIAEVGMSLLRNKPRAMHDERKKRNASVIRTGLGR